MGRPTNAFGPHLTGRSPAVATGNAGTVGVGLALCVCVARLTLTVATAVASCVIALGREVAHPLLPSLQPRSLHRLPLSRPDSMYCFVGEFILASYSIGFPAFSNGPLLDRGHLMVNTDVAALRSPRIGAAPANRNRRPERSEAPRITGVIDHHRPGKCSATLGP